MGDSFFDWPKNVKQVAFTVEVGKPKGGATISAPGFTDANKADYKAAIDSSFLSRSTLRRRPGTGWRRATQAEVDADRLLATSPSRIALVRRSGVALRRSRCFEFEVFPDLA